MTAVATRIGTSALAALVLGLPACERRERPPEERPYTTPPGVERTEPRDGPEPDPIPVPDPALGEPGPVIERHLDRARARIAARDYAVAAAEVRRAAEIVRAEGQRAYRETRDTVMAAAASLDALAQAVADGRIATGPALDRALAPTYHALAASHVRQAQLSLARRDPRRTGQELVRAADELERGYAKLSIHPPSSAGAAAEAARAIGRDLETGRARASGEVAGAIAALEREIAALGERIEAREPGV